MIGRDGRDLTPDEAAEHIAGYLIVNDWSARDIQRHEMKSSVGSAKAKDFAITIVPWLSSPPMSSNPGAPDLPPGSSRVEVTLTPTDADRDRFAALVPDGEAVEVKPMFGNLGAYVNGNMFGTGPRPCRRAAAEGSEEDEAGPVMSVDVTTEILIDRPVAEVSAYASDPSHAPPGTPTSTLSNGRPRRLPSAARGSRSWPDSWQAPGLHVRVRRTHPRRTAGHADRAGSVPDGDHLQLVIHTGWVDAHDVAQPRYARRRTGLPASAS